MLRLEIAVVARVCTLNTVQEPFPVTVMTFDPIATLPPIMVLG